MAEARSGRCATIVTVRLFCSVPAALIGANALGANQGLTSPVALPELEVTIDRSTRLLVIAPHPDDEAIGAAGLMQRVRTLGGAVRVELLTSGDEIPVGVEVAAGIAHPRASDYRGYATYLFDKRRAFEPPFTRRASPPATEQMVRGSRYRGIDLQRELELAYRSQRPHRYRQPPARR
jgi:hypothetical protein